MLFVSLGDDKSSPNEQLNRKPKQKVKLMRRLCIQTLTRPRDNPYIRPHAQMAELVDAPASGAGTGNGVEVRVLFWAPLIFPFLN
jgi:hypothetical protein